ncbi:MAG: hypothetical protein AAGD00_03965 [Planctomycetota bacterium]
MPASERANTPSRLTLLIALALASAVFFAVAGGEPPLESVFGLLYAFLSSAWLAMGWLAGAAGLGVVASKWLLKDPDTVVQTALGVALAIIVAMVLGQTVGFGGANGRIIAWTPTAIGIGLLLWSLRARLRQQMALRVDPCALLWCVPLAAIVVGACVAPGTIWSSEGNGYDTLSYHLQLPKEWIEHGRIEPLEHNVYSWLPGGMEAVYTQLAAMSSGAPGSPVGGGAGVLSAQILHALLALCACAAVARCVRTWSGLQGAGYVAGALLLATPWVLIVGASAYNEMAMLLMLAPALLVARETDAPAWTRSVVCAVLCAGAVLAKPTAMFMVALPVGAVLLASTGWRRWLAASLPGIVAGVIGLLPWLVRNWNTGNNPVFPEFTGLFGLAHWNTEQARRWSDAHHPDASVGDRFARLVSEDFGVLHTQFGAVFLAGMIGAVVALCRKDVRTVALMLLGVLVLQIGAWLTTGHLQARFLLPAALTSALLFGLGLAALRKSGVVLGAVVVLWQTWLGTQTLLNEKPTGAMLHGPAMLTGEALAPILQGMPDDDRRALLAPLGPAAYVNQVLTREGDVRLALLGSGAPMYYLVDTVYATTWDRSPVTEAARAYPDNPIAFARALARSGVTHLLVDLSELARLEVSGWLDPALSLGFGERTVRALEAYRVQSWDDRGVPVYLFDLRALERTP